MRRRRLLLAAVLVLTLVGVGDAQTRTPSRGAPTPRTLARVSGEIAALAQDGDRIAWSSFGATSCPTLSGADWQSAVHVLRLSPGVRIGLPSKRGSKSCAEFGDVYPAPTLALAGTRALWAAYTQSHQETDGYFVTAAVNDRVERRVCTFAVRGGSEDNYTPTLVTAGDGQTLVHRRRRERTDSADDDAANRGP